MAGVVQPLHSVTAGLVADAEPVQVCELSAPNVELVVADEATIRAFVASELEGADVSGFGYLFSIHGGGPQTLNVTPQNLEVDGASGINELKSPFTSHTFLEQDNGVLFRPLSVDNTYSVEVRLTLLPAAINTIFTLELDIGGTENVIEKRDVVLELGANVPHLLTLKLDFFTKNTFQANGGRFLVSASNSTVIQTADIRVFPRSVP